MNLFTKTIFTFLCLTSWGLSQNPTGQTIIDSMVVVMSPINSKSIVKQTNFYEDGKKRSFELAIFTAGKGDKMLMQYIKPKSVKGQSFLLLNDGDDIWTYFPRTRRVRKMASHAKKMKVQGGDFSFDDFSSEETWKTDYHTINTGETKLNNVSCWVLKSTAVKDADVDYTALISYVRKDNYYPIKIEYMKEKGNPEKTLTFSEISDVDGYPTAKMIIMENHLTGTKTIMETIEASNKWIPQDGFFTERNMKRDLWKK